MFFYCYKLVPLLYKAVKWRKVDNGIERLQWFSTLEKTIKLLNFLSIFLLEIICGLSWNCSNCSNNEAFLRSETLIFSIYWFVYFHHLEIIQGNNFCFDEKGVIFYCRTVTLILLTFMKSIIKVDKDIRMFDDYFYYPDFFVIVCYCLRGNCNWSRSGGLEINTFVGSLLIFYRVVVDCIKMVPDEFRRRLTLTNMWTLFQQKLEFDFSFIWRQLVSVTIIARSKWNLSLLRLLNGGLRAIFQSEQCFNWEYNDYIVGVNVALTIYTCSTKIQCLQFDLSLCLNFNSRPDRAAKTKLSKRSKRRFFNYFFLRRIILSLRA